jgi:hypothetical protein
MWGTRTSFTACVPTSFLYSYSSTTNMQCRLQTHNVACIQHRAPPNLSDSQQIKYYKYLKNVSSQRHQQYCQNYFDLGMICQLIVSICAKLCQTTFIATAQQHWPCQYHHLKASQGCQRPAAGPHLSSAMLLLKASSRRPLAAVADSSSLAWPWADTDQHRSTQINTDQHRCSASWQSVPASCHQQLIWQ